MKYVLIFLLVAVILFLAVTAYFWFTRDRYIMDGPGMINESGPLRSLSWSQSASYMEGCFSFYLYYDEEDSLYHLSANAWDKSGEERVECDSKTVSESLIREITALLENSSLISLPPENAIDSEIFALDATTVHFSLSYENWPEDEYQPPSGDLETNLYTLLLSAAS